jgi:uncharacterized protein YigE (DUF2233 family)
MIKFKIFLILLIVCNLLFPKAVSSQFFASTGQQFEGKEYDIFDLVVNARNLKNLSIEENNQKLPHAEVVKRFPNDFLFTTTFFDNSCTPLGLLIANSNIKNPTNTDPKGDGGNFFLQPNGALLLGEKDAEIETTANLSNLQSTKLGFQSGPILISGSAINSNLNSNSTNFKPRSAVGIYDDTSGIRHLVFAVSRSDVSFYQIANYLKTQFNCKSALSLISVNCALTLPFQNGGIIEQDNRICCSYFRFIAVP